MPSETYITREEESTSDFKVSKGRLTLLAGVNSVSAFKLKPVLINLPESPWALKELCSVYSSGAL